MLKVILVLAVLAFFAGFGTGRIKNWLGFERKVKADAAKVEALRKKL